MRRIVFSLVALVGIGVSLCHAQVIPVVAKQRILRDVLDSKGNVVRHTETLGRYLRNSTGSTITQEYSSLEDRPAIRSGELEDYNRRKIYQLNYEKHEAVELADLPGGPHPEYLAKTKSALGEETVNGFPCLIHSIFMTVDGEKRLIGKKYDSAEYGLGIKEDAVIEPPGGPRTHRIVELYDIQFVEPDPKEFELASFSFMGKGPLVCAKPGPPAWKEPLK
jgi:hypothetical protein